MQQSEHNSLQITIVCYKRLLDHDSMWLVAGTAQTFSNAYEIINFMQIKATSDCMKGIKISYVIKL